MIGDVVIVPPAILITGHTSDGETCVDVFLCFASLTSSTLVALIRFYVVLVMPALAYTADRTTVVFGALGCGERKSIAR